MGFIWVFSALFPRAYSVLEAKALGIDEDSVEIIKTTKVDSLLNATKNDSVEWRQVKN